MNEMTRWKGGGIIHYLRHDDLETACWSFVETDTSSGSSSYLSEYFAADGDAAAVQSAAAVAAGLVVGNDESACQLVEFGWHASEFVQ